MKLVSRRRVVIAAISIAVGSIALVVATRIAMRPFPASLTNLEARRAAIVDSEGRTISITFDNPWNVDDTVGLHGVPEALRLAFVEAEDRRFFEHGGVDWAARLHAVVQNLRAGRSVRGASTISEQVVRMLHPRRRSLWSRWVEGFEAARLERRFSKGEILEFYLNQVPYARQRRGVVQAARDLFDRDLDTLSPREMLTLAVLVRRPSGLDPRREDELAARRLDAAIERLAVRLRRSGHLTDDDLERVRGASLRLATPTVDVRAPHFANHVRALLASTDSKPARVRTTLDGALQGRLEALLERQIDLLAPRGVTDGAVLVVDHRRNEILAWVNAGGYSETREGSRIDAIVAPRQPGSTLKPFVYALAIDDGWTAATLIDDAPFAGPVGAGLHSYRNYSRKHYGPVRLRAALGNSLNIPAIRTIQQVTPERFHTTLRELGFDSLDRPSEFYGEGLALGNGEVTLYELVEAYAVLARGGIHEPFKVTLEPERSTTANRVFDSEVSSIVADILSDPGARTLEFGTGGVLELPAQVAVKTGTSNDFRDAWTVGFSDRYTVGVWMGDLNRQAMDGISGSTGPALVLRAAFAELHRLHEPRPLTVSRTLGRHRICRDTGALAGDRCPILDEWFRDGHHPTQTCAAHGAAPDTPPARAIEQARLVRPSPGLHLAMDPRIPDELEAFRFELEGPLSPARIDWFVDDRLVGVSTDRRFTWRLERGAHTVFARVWDEPESGSTSSERVRFFVK